jgi:lipopolysaccharide export LptBFGC system permease protein LptF
MFSLQQILFTTLPAYFFYSTLRNKSTVIKGLGVIGGGVAGFVVSNIVTDMRE